MWLGRVAGSGVTRRACHLPTPWGLQPSLSFLALSLPPPHHHSKMLADIWFAISSRRSSLASAQANPSSCTEGQEGLAGRALNPGGADERLSRSPAGSGPKRDRGEALCV